MITYYKLPFDIGYQKEVRRGARTLTHIRTTGLYITSNDAVFELDKIVENV